MSDTRERITQRLEMLRQEIRLGEEQLRALEQRKSELERTLMRIAGAIQVLEEVLAEHRDD